MTTVKTIVILGTGGIARGYAAALAASSHKVSLATLRAPPTPGAASRPLVASGAIAGTYSVTWGSDLGALLADADLAIVATTAEGFSAANAALVRHLPLDRPVIYSAHASLAALALHEARLAAAASETCAVGPVVAWPTTALTARAEGDAAVTVSGWRRALEVATIPAARGAEGLALCRALFGDRFVPRRDLLSIALGNLNPPGHMALMLANLTRAERGEDWSSYGSVTPAVGRLVDALDRERLAVAAGFAVPVRTVQDHYAQSFGVAPGPVAAMAAEVAKTRGALRGPRSLHTRFIDEDVPYGLMPIEALGAIAGVLTPLHTAGIELFQAFLDRDFRAANDIWPALGLAEATSAGLRTRITG